MHTIMPDPQPPAETPRGLHEICEDARRGQCDYCSAMPGEPCAFSGTGPDGYHVARFTWARAHGLISVLDVGAVLWTVTATPFTPTTVIYDPERRGTMTTAQDAPPRPTGPVETEQEARQLPVVQAVYDAFDRDPGVGKMAPHNHRMLCEVLSAARVELGAYDRRIVTWLAGWEPSTVAVIAGWVARAHLPEFGEARAILAGENLVTITAAQARVAVKALGDAEADRRERVAAYCYDCASAPQEACETHLDDLDQADAYRDLAAELTRALPTAGASDSVRIRPDLVPDVPPDEDTRRLAAIRDVLARFDWEHDDRQYALEAIERIAGGDQS